MHFSWFVCRFVLIELKRSALVYYLQSSHDVQQNKQLWLIKHKQDKRKKNVHVSKWEDWLGFLRSTCIYVCMYICVYACVCLRCGCFIGDSESPRGSADRRCICIRWKPCADGRARSARRAIAKGFSNQHMHSSNTLTASLIVWKRC